MVENSGPANIFLVGPMGVGKTTIGKLLASDLKMDFVDTDHEVEKRAGADITWIFDVEGEQGFRFRESRVLEDIANKSHQVIATGGGIVLDPLNRNVIKTKGYCVYLSANLDQLVARVGKDKKRPLLQQDSPAVILERVLKIRDPLYREVANIVVKTNTRPPRQLAKEIAKSVKASCLQ